jgi:hypothetical protein
MTYGEGPDIVVTQLAGPGVPGLEHDPPVFHFDLGMEQMPELLRDPVRFLKGLGLGPEQGVAPKGYMSVRLTGPEWIWNGRRWLASDEVLLARDDAGAGDAGARASCCYISGPAEMT